MGTGIPSSLSGTRHAPRATPFPSVPGIPLSTRRVFLRALGTAAAAAPLLVRLRSIDEAFAAQVASMPRGPLDPRVLRERYLLAPDVVYLNHASIGTVPRAVHEARVAFQLACEENPWLYIFGGAWEEAREDVRALAADLLGCGVGDVAITHNTTEGFNVLAQGLPLGRGDEVLFSSLNHDGASVCWRHRAEERGFTVRSFRFPVERAPELTADEVVDLHLRQVTPQTRVLAFPHVDNVVGLRHPLGPLCRAAHGAGVEFVLVDGAQSAGMIPVEARDAEVDAYAASPHKWVQAPKGLGLLYLRASLRERLRPAWVTWGQRRWAGSVRVYEDYGTRDMPEVLALGDALRFQERLGSRAKTAAYVRTHRNLLAAVDADPRLTWHSPRSWEMGSCLAAVRVEGRGSPKVQQRLYRDHGIVTRAFEGPGVDHLRVSPNVATTDAELARFLERAVA